MLSLILLALGVTFVTFAIPFARAYFLNVEYVDLSLGQVLAAAGLSSCMVFAAVLLSLSVTSRNLRRILLIFWTIVLVFTWMVSNFFAWHVGVLDGRRLGVFDKPLPLIIELLALAAVIAGTIRFRRQIVAHVGLLSVVLSLWSAAALIPVAMNYQEKRDVLHTHEIGKFNEKDGRLVQFSKRSNILLFVLDTAQSNVMRRVLKKRSELAGHFPGFTFYQNNVSAFSKTYLSLPAILTSQEYANDRPVPDFLREAYFTQNSIPYRLHQAGYDTRAHLAYETPQLPDPRLWNNLENQTDIIGDIVQLLRVSLFNAAPLPLKAVLSDDIGFEKVVRDARKILGDQADLDDDCKPSKLPLQGQVERVNDVIFLERLLSCSKATLDYPAFRLFHLQGTHEPFYISALTDTIEAPPGEEGYYRQAEGILRIMAAVMDRLKTIGVYDKATIVIAGDHGAHEYGIGVDPADYDGSGTQNPEQSGPGQTVIAAGLSLLMVKPSANASPLEFSDIPTSTLDIAPTILNAAGLDHQGQDISSITSPRARHHNYYAFENWSVRYVDGLYRYAVNGKAWRPSSWSDKGIPILPTVPESVNALDILLYQGGNRDSFTLTSSIPPGPEGILVKDLHIDLGARRFPGKFVKVTADLEDGPEPEVIETVFNGKSRGNWLSHPDAFPDVQERIFPLEDGVAESVSFAAPVENGSGYALLRSLTLQVARPMTYTFGQVLTFDRMVEIEPLAIFGWSEGESWGRWSDSLEAGLLLDLTERPRGDLRLNLDATAFISTSAPEQKIEVLANGVSIGELEYRDGHWLEDLVLSIPYRAVQDSKTILLVFRIKHPGAPAWEGTSEDNRLLGFGLRSLRLVEAGG